MNYEKKYKEALEMASNLYKDAVEMENNMTTKTCEIIFPELRESEDEKIRKVLVDFFKSYKEQGTCGAETFNGISTSNILAWLEMQGEKKPAAWSEYDRKIIIELIGIFESAVDGGHVSFPYRLLKDYTRVLKSCLHQSSWKPSEEQMVTLEYYMHTLVCNSHKETLFSLYQDLKKLREE